LKAAIFSTSAANFLSVSPSAATPKAFASSLAFSPNYEVIVVPVTGCLHLKSAVTFLGRDTLLANRAWFDPFPFSGHDWVDVDPAEPHAANALALANTIIFPASFPRTRARIESAGFHVTPIDISELQKAESGLTCSSLIFEA
jgi:dimethylargininase